MDRLVSSAPAALVSRRNRRSYPGDGIGAGVVALPSASMARCLFFYRDAVADRRNSERELYVFELSRARIGRPLAGRSLCAGRLASEVEKSNRPSSRVEGTLHGPQRATQRPGSVMEHHETLGQRAGFVMDLLCDYRGTNLDVWEGGA